MSTFFDSLAIPLELTASAHSVFLDQHGLSLAITKERQRSDRYGHSFSVVSLKLLIQSSVDGALDSGKLAEMERILATRLRLTDERGVNRDGSIVIVLPQTDYDGAVTVVESLAKLASFEQIHFGAEIHVYPTLSEGHFKSHGSSERDKSLRFDEGCEDSAAITHFDGKANIDELAPSTRSVLVAQHPSSLHMIAKPFPRWKRSMDIVCAASGLVVAAPFLIATAIAIKATSKGPVFFWQWRTGQNSQPFRIMKLRTMVVDADELKDKLREMNERDGPAFKIKNDPRVTRVGNFLRSTGLDELPQLWNVLISEMSIVGPRPLPVDEDALCEQWQRRRLDTKPGITCSWQIAKSRKISFEDWMRMDIRYATTRSFKNDLKLMFKTVAAVVLGRVGH
ncbi:MAG: sugar transferase [Planctomycetota bacterium]|nr:sugar transferase [Planctomycetota bacterium]